ncbi:MAG TPA: hypothetical protein VGN47_02440 [Blastococcus sp.]|jgi:hypothetical protein|nr:hypothetical protein [Blastococcus sp.]
MTDTGHHRPEAASTLPTYAREEHEPTGWTGWVVFASVMMLLVGSWQFIQGLVALFDDGFYKVHPNGLVVHVNYNVWGWTHMLLGAVIALSAVGILAGNIVARTVGVLFAGLSAIANLAFIEAYPFWSILIIGVDVVVIYALTVHGRELRGSTM